MQATQSGIGIELSIPCWNSALPHPGGLPLSCLASHLSALHSCLRNAFKGISASGYSCMQKPPATHACRLPHHKAQLPTTYCPKTIQSIPSQPRPYPSAKCLLNPYVLNTITTTNSKDTAALNNNNLLLLVYILQTVVVGMLSLILAPTISVLHKDLSTASACLGSF